MSVLIASPYSLLKGDLVVAQVQAQNSKGWGTLSTENSSGIKVETVPVTMATPTKGSATSASQVQVDWTAITDLTSDSGGTDSTVIQSYNLQWDAGTNGGTWTDLLGVSPLSTVTTYTVSSGIVAGTTYKFQVRARNKYGYGSFSSIASITAALAPSASSSVTTT